MSVATDPGGTAAKARSPRKTATSPARIPASEGVIARASAIMRFICERGEDASISDMALTLGISPSSVHRLLDDLVRAGWVERTPHHRYRVDFEFYRIGALATAQVRPVRLVGQVLSALSLSCHETAVFAMHMPDRQKMVLVAQAQPAQPLRWRFEHHVPRSLLWGAPGRAMLAHLPLSLQESVLRQATCSPRGWAAPTWAQWRTESDRIQAQGVAVTEGHFTELACGIASPVFDHTGLIGALAFIIPRYRFEAGDRETLITALRRSASNFSRSLGAPLTPPRVDTP